MSDLTALVPSQTSFLTVVSFFERCQAKKKSGSAKSDLDKLIHTFQSTEEGRADLFSFYRLLFPKAPICCFCVLSSGTDP